MKRRLQKWWDGFTGRRAERLHALKTRRRSRDVQAAIAKLQAMLDALPPGHPDRLPLINDIFLARSLATMAGL